MSAAAPTRTLSAAGVVTLAAGDAQFVFKRPRPGVLLIEASGDDMGQFGSSALDEITNALHRERPLELFIDTSAAVSVTPRVREEWTRFFSSNRDKLIAVHVLTSSRLVHLAVAVAQLFSRTGDLIRLYSARPAFDAQLQRAAPQAGAPLKR
jgi:hypothetical protein